MSREQLAKHFEECQYVATIILETYFIKEDHNGNKFITTDDSVFADPFDPTTDANMIKFINESDYIEVAMDILINFNTYLSFDDRIKMIRQVMTVCGD